MPNHLSCPHCGKDMIMENAASALGMTAKQYAVMRFIQVSQGQTGRAPLLREIAGEFGINESSARSRVAGLIKRGFVARTYNAEAGLEILKRLPDEQRARVW
jgi:DNA-binding MarR family transcriptional regulator